MKPTLVAAGADLDRVAVYDPSKFKGSPLTLPDDLDLVKSAVKEVNAKLLVIDPAASFFTCNANSDQAVRKALVPLEELAKKKGLAVLIVRHLNKGNSGNPLYRASGSIQWIAAARSALPGHRSDRFEHPRYRRQPDGRIPAQGHAFQTRPGDQGAEALRRRRAPREAEA